VQSATGGDNPIPGALAHAAVAVVVAAVSAAALQQI
jgi:hypothetical protein